MDRRSLLSHLFENNISLRSDRAIETLTQYIQNKSQFLPHNIDEIISKFVYRARERWQKANRTKAMFLKQNESWLNEVIVRNKGGRPSVDFNMASTRTKNRRVEGIVTDYSSDEILYAASKKFKSEHNNEMAREVNKFDDDLQTECDPEETLALILDTNMTKASYQIATQSCCKKKIEHLSSVPYH